LRFPDAEYEDLAQMDADSALRARQKSRIYYPPRLKLYALGVACLTIAAALLWAVFVGTPGADTGIPYIQIAALLLFGGGGVGIMYRAMKRKPVLTMEPDGLTLWISSGHPEHVDWDSIADMAMIPAPGMQVLSITRRPMQSHWADRAVFWKRGDRSSGSPEIAIPSVSVATPLRKVEAEIRRRTYL